MVSSRQFLNRELVYEVLDQEYFHVLVTGGRRGADRMAEQFAIDRDIQLQVHLPQFRKHGKAAYRKHYEAILQNCDRLIVFWDGMARGPKQSLEMAKALGKSYRTVMY
ncbi:MAG: SLOG family protein [Bacteroidota bacterium]